MLFFIIPAYNEEKNIPLLLESIGKKMEEIRYPYRLVIVNDGSVDRTKEILESYQDRFPITLLNHDTNRNVGQAFRTAFDHVLDQARPGDIIITKEADNTSDLNILPAMLEKIREGYDLVLASCYAKGGNIMGTTIDRIILSFFANLILRTLFPIHGVYTYSSFYRAYRADSIKRAFNAYQDRLIEENGFVCMVEMLIKLSRLPMSVVEVPMVLRCDFRKGVSKMKRSATTFAYFRLISKELKNNSKAVRDIVARYKKSF